MQRIARLRPSSSHTSPPSLRQPCVMGHGPLRHASAPGHTIPQRPKPEAPHLSYAKAVPNMFRTAAKQHALLSTSHILFRQVQTTDPKPVAHPNQQHANLDVSHPDPAVVALLPQPDRVRGELPPPLLRPGVRRLRQQDSHMAAVHSLTPTKSGHTSKAPGNFTGRRARPPCTPPL